MSRLIDADALIDVLTQRCCKNCDKRMGTKNGKRRMIYEIGEAPCRACDVDDLKMELDEAPTIDAEPIRHGHWNIVEGMPTQCSCCGYYVKQRTYKFCPICGARMDEDEISNIAKKSADKISNALEKVRAKGMQKQNIKEDDEP